jgi:Tfp pilus assembly protein PilX
MQTTYDIEKPLKDRIATLEAENARLREAAEAALANMEHYGDNEPRDQKVKAMLRTALQPTPPQGASE